MNNITLTKSGPESLLTEDLSLRIRTLLLQGKKIKEIQKWCGIKPGTWDKWYFENHKDFRQKITNWRKERFLQKSISNIEEMLEMETSHEVRQGEYSARITDPRLLKIKLEASKFVLENFKSEKDKQATELSADRMRRVLEIFEMNRRGVYTQDTLKE